MAAFKIPKLTIICLVYSLYLFCLVASGFYEVVEVKKWCQKEFSYPATDFTVYPQDVSTKVGECLHPMTDPAHPKEGECKEHACGSGNVVHSFKIMSKNVNFRCGI